MITLITNVLPIMLGYAMKFVAVLNAQKKRQSELKLLVFNKQTELASKRLESSQTESPASAWNRRFLLVIVMLLICFYVFIGLTDVPMIVETIQKGYSLFGFIPITDDKIEYVTVKGILVFKDIFEWATIIIEMYFGAHFARA